MKVDKRMSAKNVMDYGSKLFADINLAKELFAKMSQMFMGKTAFRRKTAIECRRKMSSVK